MIFPDSFSPTFTLTDAEISFHKPIDFFAINESLDKNLEVLIHHHIFFEMIYVLKGSITHSINVTETTSISSGEYILIDIGTSHQLHVEDAHLINIIFTPQLINKKIQNCSSMNELLRNSTIGLESYSDIFPTDKVLKDTDGVLLNLLMFLKSKFETPQNLSNSIFKDCISAMLKHMIEPVIGSKQTLHPISDFLIKLVDKSYFEHNLINHAVIKLHSPKSYISTIFKKDFNITFTEYLQIYRINKAKSLLDSTNMSINDISLAVGYSDIKSFRALFKRYTNMSPKEYKNSHY